MKNNDTDTFVSFLRQTSDMLSGTGSVYIVQYIEKKEWKDFYAWPTETFEESFKRLKDAKAEYPKGIFRVIQKTLTLTSEKVYFDEKGNIK